MIPHQSIPEFYDGKTVFVTGGTGLLGKILIEKLLRSCPGISNLYMLVRTRKNVTPEDRIKEYCDHEIFQLLKTERPDAVNKIKIVPGDVATIGLGLSSEDRQFLQDNINIVFNVAASVRFNDPLHQAIITNVRGTREMVDIALGMKNLQVFTHISTAFSNTDLTYIEEKIYPPHGDWRALIKAAETLDPVELEIISKKLLGKLANTYIFSKSLAEHVINDHRHLLPVVLIRPSVVVGVVKEPLPGYVDNFNGPVGLIFATGKGMMRVAWADQDKELDCIPVDVVVKGTIIATWKRGLLPSPDGIEVYNATNNGTFNASQREITEHGKAAGHIAPVTCFYYPTIVFTTSRLMYLILFYLTQLSVAVFFDFLLCLPGNKPKMVKIQRRIFQATNIVHYFALHDWTFKNDRFLKLENDVLDCDIRDYMYHMKDSQCFTYFLLAIRLLRYTLLQEKWTPKQAKILYNFLYLLHCFLCSTAVWVVIWASYTYSLPQQLLSLVIRALQTLLML